MAEYGFTWPEVSNMPDNAIEYLADAARKRYARRKIDDLNIAICANGGDSRVVRASLVKDALGEGAATQKIVGSIAMMKG